MSIWQLLFSISHCENIFIGHLETVISFYESKYFQIFVHTSYNSNSNYGSQSPGNTHQGTRFQWKHQESHPLIKMKYNQNNPQFSMTQSRNKRLWIALILFFRRPRDGGLLIHVEDTAQHQFTYPKPSHVTYKFHHTSPIIEDNFYYDLSKVNKKRPKFGKLKPDSGYQEVGDLFGLGQLFRQVSPPSVGYYGEVHGDDVKPVTELIEGDLKYDFRTKTHSIRWCGVSDQLMIGLWYLFLIICNFLVLWMT